MINRMVIVGHGSIGKRHLTILRQLLPKAEIAILRHKKDLEIPEGADRVYSKMDEVIEFSPQMAVIANPATFHVSTAMPLAEAGIHLLIEKPLSTSSYGVDKLIEICNRRKTVLAIGYNLRHLESLQKFKSFIDKKLIGDIWSVRSEIGQYLPSWRPDNDYTLSVSARKKHGGGSLLELSHEIDYLRWIFGEIDWIQATLSKQSDLLIDVEDTAHLILGFAANNDGKQLIASVNLDFIRQDTTRVCIAVGKSGSLRWNALTGTVEIWKLGMQGWEEIYKQKTSMHSSYIDECKDFIESIEKGSEPKTRGEDGLRVLQVIDAARKANETRSQVKINKHYG